MNLPNNIKRLRLLNYIFIFCLTAVIFLSQMLIFDDRKEIGLSILFGTSGTLAGCFAAFLASPYNSNDKERLSGVGSIISTLITGYVLAKIIDPLVALLTDKEKLPQIFEAKNGANVLIAVICFLGGFLLVYQYRAYISGQMSVNEPGSGQDDGIENPIDGNKSQTLIKKNPART